MTGIGHSAYPKPEFILQRIGPARFRSHYLSVANAIVLDLFTAELSLASLPADAIPGETVGLSPAELLGRRMVAVARDDCHSTVIILEGGLFLKDANDGCYGNPLLAAALNDY